LKGRQRLSSIPGSITKRAHARTLALARARTHSRAHRNAENRTEQNSDQDKRKRQERRGRGGAGRRGVGGGGRGAREISGNLEVLADAVGSTRTRCGGGECEEIGRIVAVLSTP
jgi:hypothetical protein